MKNLLALMVLSLVTTTAIAQSTESVSFESSFPEKEAPKKVDFEVYLELLPNPFDDKIYIKTTHPVKEVQLFDESGKTIFESMGSNELDLNHLPSGKYLLRIRHSEGVVSKMIEKK